ncbi:hypothetical protein [Rhizobium laguerreae]|uniref:hypothetical protein n=1 Tax=Rhizobium laguerreae TaxID=1076926 RepID=UPI001389EED1|nr:hypothetical protein [Rhizobium laguerreae]NDK49081.1 hypothetical protein [Rhizobium laguerreae]
MANSVRLRASRHLEQRASCRSLLAAQLLSRGDLVDRDAPSADCQNQATTEASEFASAGRQGLGLDDAWS